MGSKFKMPDSSSFKVIREIFSTHDKEDTKELNAFLSAGWVLVDIHQRDYIDSQTNQLTKITVYIVGNTDAEALPPS
jgi:hypothetical protein